MAQVNECNALYSRYPNFILVSMSISVPMSTTDTSQQLDWISVGDFLEVQAYLNGVGTL